MQSNFWKTTACAIAAMLATGSVPAMAAPHAGASHAEQVESWNHGRDRGHHHGWSNGRGHGRDYYRDGYRYQGRYYADRYRGDHYRPRQVWRGHDGRYYCRRDDGTTGLLIGAVVGGVVGNEVAGYGDKGVGTLIGALGGGLLGRAIDRDGSRCR